MVRVKGQYFCDRQTDRNRGLSEWMLPMAYVNREFQTFKEAEEFAAETFPQPQKMREWHTIEID